MTNLLRGLFWAILALSFGAAGAILVLAATVLGVVFDWTLTLLSWSMLAVCWGVRCVWRIGK